MAKALDHMPTSVSPATALEESQERLRLALDIAALGTLDVELATGEMDWSDKASEMFGATPEELGDWDEWIGCFEATDQIALREMRSHLEIHTSAPEGQGAFTFVRPDGGRRLIAHRVRLIRDHDGRPLRLSGIVSDQTGRRDSRRRTALLLAELQHRVKNILAVVRSIASRTLETSDTLEEFSAHFDGRISALGRLQGALARTAEGSVDLEELVREEFLHQSAPEGDQLVISGEPVLLRQKTAEAIGLALHELATNAVKFGALASGGKISLSWRADTSGEQPMLVLDWVESGVPLLDTAPEHVGFGRELIEEGLPYQLGAETTLAFAPGGVRCSIRLPFATTALAGETKRRSQP